MTTLIKFGTDVRTASTGFLHVVRSHIAKYITVTETPDPFSGSARYCRNWQELLLIVFTAVLAHVRLGKSYIGTPTVCIHTY